jgi:hypothetical protein
MNMVVGGKHGVPRWLYHGTPTDAVPSILRHGLVPTKAWELADLPGGAPKAVWLTTSWQYARLNGTRGGRRPGTVLLVNVKNLDLVDVGPFGWVYYSLEPIKAKRIAV